MMLLVTHDLLSKAGLVYITAPNPAASVGDTDGLGSQASLLDAFADAAMLWTKIVGGCLTLVESLLAEGRWDEVRSLATVLNDAGETGVAEDLRERLPKAMMARYKERLDTINISMKPPEIKNAIEVFTNALSEIPESIDRDVWLNSFLPALAASALKYIKEDAPGHYDVEYTAEGQNMSSYESVGNSIAEIAAAFRTRATR
jgi:hypothetical protein